MPRVVDAALRTFAALNIRIYRASKGRLMGKVRGTPVLLLTVSGRKTGVPRTTPVAYVKDGERFIVTGSAGGLPTEPQWFRNLRAAPQAEVEVGAQRFPVSVSVAEGDEHDRLWRLLVSQAPFFGDYQAKTERQIPMAVLTPVS